MHSDIYVKAGKLTPVTAYTGLSKTRLRRITYHWGSAVHYVDMTGLLVSVLIELGYGKNKKLTGTEMKEILRFMFLRDYIALALACSYYRIGIPVSFMSLEFLGFPLTFDMAEYLYADAKEDCGGCPGEDGDEKTERTS